MITLNDQKTLKRNSQDWLNYFRQNNEELLEIPWDENDPITQEEKNAIEKSVQIFQLGERSEGKHLAKCAKEYAMQTEDYAYFEAIKLFIKEEQRHARDLGRFMKLNDIAIIQKTPTDSVFRWLRHLANLEMSVSILVAAEIVAQGYYPALQKATQSKILKRLCDQIIEDEDDHVTFQSQRLAILRKNNPQFMIPVIHFIYRLFFLTTITVVWFGHKPVFKRAGLSFLQYIKDSFNRLNSAIYKMNPKNVSVDYDKKVSEPIHTADCQN